MAANAWDYVNPKDVSDGYHIPSGRKVHTDAKGKLLISNVGYSERDGVSAGTMPASSRQPYVPGAAKPQQRQVSPRTRPASSGQAKPFESGRTSDGILPKGMFTGWGQRYRSDGEGGRTEVNVVRRGQGATLNGKNVTADGQGNWRTISPTGGLGTIVGSYKVGVDRGDSSSASNKPQVKPPKPPVDPGKPPVDPGKPPVDPGKPPVDPGKPPKVPTGRDTGAPDGSPSKGTSMGSSVLQMEDVNKILNGRGVPAIADPYSSNNLPGIDYSGEDAASFGRSRQDSAAIASGGSIETTFDGSETPVSVIQRAGASDLVQSGGSTASSPVVKGVNGTEFGGEHEAPATSGFDMARRRAFLDADSGLRGMEAVKAQKGMATFGGQSYIADPNNDGQMKAIDQSDKRTLLGQDQQKAQDLLGSYVSSIKETDKDEDTV